MIVEVACPIPVSKLFDYRLPENLQDTDPSQIIGRRVRIPFGFKQAIGVISGMKATGSIPVDRLKEVSELLDAEPLLTPGLFSVAEWMANRYLCSLGEAAFALMPPRKSEFKQLKEKSSAPFDIPHGGHWVAGELPIEHTPDQRAAAETLHHAVYDHKFRGFLLQGGAATGKTEVYMAVIKDVLAQGKTVLMMAPEIGLAIQVYDVLKDRFGEKSVMLLHSDLAVGERIDRWWRIKRGEFPIIVGPRSAVLAPLENIGAVIVDEEHDPSYKEDRKPRFHARDVAWERAKMGNAVLVLGSATPSLETVHAVNEGLLERVDLMERAIPASKPRIRLIDFRQEKARGGALGPTLMKEIEARVKAGEQTILFLNKRGFFRFLRCPECAWVARCPNCEIALVFHKSEIKDSIPEPVKGQGKKKPPKKYLNGYGCHYCSHFQKAPESCPQCHHKKLFAGGFGTQRVAEELQAQLPWIRTLRWDRDAVSRRGMQDRHFHEFSAGDYDVLVGTQMVAQGFNFPKVTLVGVVDADGPLHIPDFRSAERTFQLVTQVAGRAGRALVTGDVLIQTRNPDHYALKYAVEMDFVGFAQRELGYRDELNYPPFSHLVQIIASAKDEKKAEENLNRLIDHFSNAAFPYPVGLIGPSKTKRQRQRGRIQLQLLAKVRNPVFDEFLIQLRGMVADKPSEFMINVDPEGI